MAAINVTTSDLRSCARTLLDILNDQYDPCVASTKGHAEEINDQWEGDAKKEFQTQMVEADAHLQKIRKLIEEYARFLEQTAKKYDDADRQARQHVNRFHR